MVVVLGLGTCHLTHAEMACAALRKKESVVRDCAHTCVLQKQGIRGHAWFRVMTRARLLRTKCYTFVAEAGGKHNTAPTRARRGGRRHRPDDDLQALARAILRRR